jgi:hypothetical protein
MGNDEMDGKVARQSESAGASRIKIGMRFKSGNHESKSSFPGFVAS